MEQQKLYADYTVCNYRECSLLRSDIIKDSVISDVSEQYTASSFRAEYIIAADKELCWHIFDPEVGDSCFKRYVNIVPNYTAPRPVVTARRTSDRKELYKYASRQLIRTG